MESQRRRHLSRVPDTEAVGRPRLCNTFAILFVTCLTWSGAVSVWVDLVPGFKNGVTTSEDLAIFTDPKQGICLRCMANSPIEWIANIEFDEVDGLSANGPYDYGQKEWSIRERPPWTGKFEFTSLIVLPFGNIKKQKEWLCRAVSNHRDNVRVTLTPASDSGAPTVHMTMTIDDDNWVGPERKRDSCDMTFTVGKFDDIYYWRCESQLDMGMIAQPEDELEIKVLFSFCQSPGVCANSFRESRVSQNCIHHVKNLTSVGTEWTPIHDSRAGVALCLVKYPGLHIYRTKYLYYHDVLGVVEYFFSARRTETGALEREIQFSQPCMNTMGHLMWIEPALKNVYYTADVLDARCVVPTYGFSIPIRAIARLNGTKIWENDEHTPSVERVDGERVHEKHVNISFRTENGTDMPGIYTIECVASVWNTTEWSNHSTTIEVRTPSGPEFSSDHVEITLEDGEADRTLRCDPTGDPMPDIIGWDFGSATGVREEGNMLVITRVSEKLPQLISCIATNKFNRSQNKLFKIHVRKSALVGIIAGSVAGVVVLAGLAFLYWRKSKRVRYLASLLTDSEVQELLEGKKAAELGYDRPVKFEMPLAIQSLPYNSKFEIVNRNLVIDFEMELGSGHYGVVYKGKLKRSKLDLHPTPVAVKTVHRNVNVEYFKALMSELKIMIHLGRHENVVRLIGACTRKIRKRELFVVVELCKTSLLDFLRENREEFEASFLHPAYHTTNASMSEVGLIIWAAEIAAGMAFLTEKLIVHGDLAARNVLLTHDLHVKISDFGLARQLINHIYIKSEESAIRQLLPWKWMALESLCESREFSTRSDVWSYGVTLWEIFSLGDEPYQGLEFRIRLLEELEAGFRLSKPKYADDLIFAVMKRCWLMNPPDRPKFVDLLGFFQL